MQAPRSSTIPTPLGGRYRLLRALAQGGMAAVFEARDEVLERRVAVKLLHAHLAADPTFLERFRREARAAAGLSHPNVVPVYDWGEDREQAYLVMELIEGPSLRDVLRSRGRLSPAETLAILRPAAMGIAAAHGKQLVHRDVKPENILLATDGTVKVTDFGLARAIASEFSTFAPGTLVGSPHYLAPEALGEGRLDGRADVYALGIVLYECLVGRPPFQGESPMATALRHAAEPVPPPSRVVPGLPRTLDDVVARATRNDPSERFADAYFFASALLAAVPGAAKLSTPGAGDQHTVVLPAEATETIVPLRPHGPSGAPPASVSQAKDDAPRPARQQRTRKDRRWRLRRRILLPLLLLLLVAGGAAAGWATLIAPIVPIPQVQGLPEARAVADLEDAGFRVTVAGEREHSTTVALGHVLHQEPLGAERRGTLVTLVLSGGPRSIEIPPLRGATESQAAAQLAAAGLVPRLVAVNDDAVEPGLVVGTSPPAGEVVDEGTDVDVLVSHGPAPVEVPRVIGLARAEAEARLADAGLRPVVAVEVHHDDIPAGHVVAQDPGEGQVRNRGDEVALTLSSGPAPFAMPDVRGEMEQQARQTLEGLGLRVEVVEVPRGAAIWRRQGEVADQDPRPGTQVRRGQRVTIYVWA